MRTFGRLSLTTRIALFSGVVGTLLSVVLSALLLSILNRMATEHLTREITAAGAHVVQSITTGNLHNPIPPHELARNIQVVDRARGQVVAATANLQDKPPVAGFVPEREEKSAAAVICGGLISGSECNIVVAQRVGTTPNLIVYSASPVVPPPVNPQVAALVGSGAVLLAATITYLGHRIPKAALKPVRAIITELDEINEASPGNRVPVPPHDGEIHDLAVCVNHTLNRLQLAMEQQRQFAADASHDLRTPIAAIRAEVEDALLAPDQTNVTTLARAILASTDRLQALVVDLLALTQLDSGLPGARDLIDLSELVQAELGARPFTKRLELQLEPGVLVIGDWTHLSRLLINLVDNAERHADTTITVIVHRRPGSHCGSRRFSRGAAVLEVLDDGAGIDPDKWEVVFQRFARLDAARSKDAGGTGLGLPIARQIAEAMGGSLRIEPSTRGARFVMCLPSATPSGSTDAPACRRATGTYSRNRQTSSPWR